MAVIVIIVQGLLLLERKGIPRGNVYDCVNILVMWSYNSRKRNTHVHIYEKTTTWDMFLLIDLAII